MQQDDIKKKLDIADIGYYGKPLDRLSRDDLIEFCLRLAQTIYEYGHKEPFIQAGSHSEK